MGKDIYGLEPHERRETHRRAHVVGKDEEGRAVRDDHFAQGHPVKYRAHGMLTDPEVYVPSGASRKKIPHALQDSVRRRCEVSGASHKERRFFRYGVKDLPGG